MKAVNLPSWVESAVITSISDRVFLVVRTLYGTRHTTFKTLKQAKSYFSRNYGKRGVRWVP